MANKFELVVNSQEQDGFSFKFQADDEKSLAVFQEISKALIEKITVIEVKVNNNY